MAARCALWTIVEDTHNDISPVGGHHASACPSNYRLTQILFAEVSLPIATCAYQSRHLYAGVNTTNELRRPVLYTEYLMSRTKGDNNSGHAHTKHQTVF